MANALSMHAVGVELSAKRSRSVTLTRHTPLVCPLNGRALASVSLGTVSSTLLCIQVCPSAGLAPVRGRHESGQVVLVPVTIVHTALLVTVS